MKTQHIILSHLKARKKGARQNRKVGENSKIRKTNLEGNLWP
jgi:hypothetical protein